jgi:isocitrate dehydrogenase kinase/phosphatase
MNTETLARHAAQAISQAFDSYQQQFHEITHRARLRFESRDWHGMHRDMVERLEVREEVIRQVVAAIRALLDERLYDKRLWAQMKAAYLLIIDCRANPQLAETFFNSITRRVFATHGVDPNIEFVDSEFECEGTPAEGPVYKVFAHGTLPALVKQILLDCGFRVPYQDVDLDTRLVSAQIEAQWRAAWATEPVQRIEVLRPVFYRGKGAYIVGRICGADHLLPLVLALLNDERGIFVDAVLLTEDDASIVFSFTRSYFHVHVDRPREIISFLHSIMPLKRLAELYISIGYHKHGKTELYRDFIYHLGLSSDSFVVAPGERGMVMIVFTLPSYDLVFKVIRDQFDYPKTTTRREVMDKYALVFRHDRAGRLVDAQEFEYMRFPRTRFLESLLRELTRTAPSMVSYDGEDIVIRHLYTERRVTPLNLFLQKADAPAARAAVVDYGQAIKDLAATNIFPGDLLLKNFGVTRHGRVIFYDYDELGQLSDYFFRDLPQPADLDEEMEAEPWFYVGPTDIFPEEFIQFLGFRDDLKTIFVDAHGDLLRPSYWREMQVRHQAGEIMDIFPYPQDRRLVR